MHGKAAAPKTVEEYLAALTPKERKALQAVRRTIRAAAPEATEHIGYGMPGYKQKGVLVYFAAFTNHLTFFAGGAINEKFAKDLKSFEQTKGGIHFTPEKPIPAALITRIVKLRVRENEVHAKAKAKEK
jgi:uncharacterized protein YdhG (YjbR/CyaY superfamily)